MDPEYGRFAYLTVKPKMTFRFVLQNKNALLLTVLEIERTIYIGSSALGDE